MTALDKSFTLTVSLSVIFYSTLTLLLFSWFGNPFVTLCLFRLSLFPLMAFHLSSSDSLMEPPILHLAGTRLANSLSYRGISNSDFLCHSVGPELCDCTRIPLAHPLQSLN